MEEPELRAVLQLINEERTYERPLAKKSLHKLVYTVQQAADENGLDLSLPYFWYQFGTLSPVTPTTSEHSRISAESTVLRDNLRPIINDVLDQYYSTGIEGVTDAMYRNAPYDVQREFRELDKKIRTLHDDYNDFYEVEPSRDSILDSVFGVYDTFPSVKFPERDQDLSKWYTMFVRELDKPDFDPDRLMQINLLFWRAFALHLAEDHRHRMTKQEVKEELGIRSFEAARESASRNLLQLENETLDELFADTSHPVDGETRSRAADAAVEPLIADELGVSFSD